LLEPQRTNFEAHSEYLDAAAVKDNVVITSNATTSLEGVDNASNLVDNATSGLHRFYSIPSTTAASGVTMTHSIFAKANGHSWFQLSSGGQTNDQWANFDLTNGVIGNSSASANADIQPMGNGWYRCVINSTTSASSALVATIPTLTNDTDASTRSPVYSGSGNGVFLYGLQCEEGSYPTSYIPTYGSSVTRSADSCVKTGISSLIGDSEGTLYFEASVFDNTGSYFVSLSDGTVSNRVSLGANTSVGWNLILTVGGVNQAVIQENTPVVENQIYKVAIKYNINDFKMYVNGSQVGADISGSTYAGGTLSRLALDVAGGALPFYGNVKQLIVFPTALSNTELAALTTI
jgi:hypothetical protein